MSPAAKPAAPAPPRPAGVAGEGVASLAQTPAIEVHGAAVSLDGRTIWSGLDLKVARGEFVALLGANGAGKSTLLKVLLGLLAPAGGTVRVLGGAPGVANSAIGYLPQRRSFDPSTRLRGSDIVRLGLDGDRWGLPLPLGRGRAGSRSRLAAERVREAIELVGASAYAKRAIGELSGGEQQRLLLAQALVRRPKLLLLDEPLDSLDLPSQGAAAASIAAICRERDVAVLLVAHDVNPLTPYLDRVAYIARGRAVEGAVAQVINSATLSRLYRVPIEVLRASDGRLVVVGQPEAPAHHHDRHGLVGEHGHAG